jgi:hypothetical protein
MKKLKLIGVLVSCLISLPLTGQEIAYFEVNEVEKIEYLEKEASDASSVLVYEVAWLKTNEVEQVAQTDIEQHFLGEQIAKKKYLLDNTFTRQVPIGPGNPITRTEVSKPYLYNAVNKIERYLVRNVKRGNVSEDVAKEKMNIVLDVILNTYFIETDKLEEMIRKANKPDELLSVFINDVKVILN